MPLNRQQLSQLYRPQSVKALSVGNAFVSGGQFTVPGGQIDLSVPIRGWRIKFSGRDLIGGADMTSITPMAYANLIKRILITGRNARAGGANQTLLDLDLSSYMLHTALYKGNKVPPWRYTINGVTISFVGFPIANSNLGNVAQATYDFNIIVDFKGYPIKSADPFKLGYFLRNQEWGDSLSITVYFGTIITAGGGTDSLGVEAAATTHTLTAFASAEGNPTVDVYSLPIIPGLDIDSSFVPGFYSRVVVPVTTQVQTAGSLQTVLATLQKQRTGRVTMLSGVSALPPSMSSFNDTNVTTAGMIVGGNRVVRENDDVDVHKHEIADHYETQIIQGVTPFDFMQSGNPDAAYPGDQVGAGATFEVRGTVAGLANALLNTLQEIELYRPNGPLYAA